MSDCNVQALRWLRLTLQIKRTRVHFVDSIEYCNLWCNGHAMVVATADGDCASRNESWQRKKNRLFNLDWIVGSEQSITILDDRRFSAMTDLNQFALPNFTCFLPFSTFAPVFATVASLRSVRRARDAHLLLRCCELSARKINAFQCQGQRNVKRTKRCSADFFFSAMTFRLLLWPHRSAHFHCCSDISTDCNAMSSHFRMN